MSTRPETAPVGSSVLLQQGVDTAEAREATRPARLRTVLGDQVSELSLEPELGPRLVPVDERGPALATLFLEALDRSAARTLPQVHVRREGIDLYLDVPPEWRRPVQPPSIALGGDELAPVSERRLGRQRREEHRAAQAARALGETRATVLREYPQRRRTLAAARLRLDTELLRVEDALRARQRLIWYCLAGVASGLAGAVWGSLGGALSLFAFGSVAFCCAAAGVFALRWSHPELLGLRERHERRLATVHERAEHLDALARELAAEIQFSDPWEAATALRAASVSEQRVSGLAAARVEELARELAEEVGEEAGTLGDEDVRREADRRGEHGWPAEVSDGADGPRRPVALLLALARLILRVEAHVPQPWPIVLWEPWADQSPELRARLLLALSKRAAPRAVVAFVRAGASDS